MSNAWTDASSTFWASPPFSQFTASPTLITWMCDCGEYQGSGLPDPPSWAPVDLLEVVFVLAKPGTLPGGPWAGRLLGSSAIIGNIDRVPDGAHLYVSVCIFADTRAINYPAVLPFDLLPVGLVSGVGSDIVRTLERERSQSQHASFANITLPFDTDVGAALDDQWVALNDYVYPIGSPDPHVGTLSVTIQHGDGVGPPGAPFFSVLAGAHAAKDGSFGGNSAEIHSDRGASAVAYYASTLDAALAPASFHHWRDWPLDFQIGCTVASIELPSATQVLPAPPVFKINLYYAQAPATPHLADYYDPAPGTLLQQIRLDPAEHGWTPEHAVISAVTRETIKLSEIPYKNFILWMQPSSLFADRLEIDNFTVGTSDPYHRNWDVSYLFFSFLHIDTAVVVYRTAGYPLRMNQRADGLGLNSSPRLAGANSTTSEQGALLRRVGGRNTFI